MPKCRSRKVSIPPWVRRLLADLLSTTAQFSGCRRGIRGEGFTGTQPTLGTHLRAYEHTAAASLQASRQDSKMDALDLPDYPEGRL